MAINHKALTLFNNACIWLDAAANAENLNESIRLSTQADVAIKLAVFAVENPLLIQGIDPASPSQMSQYPFGTPGMSGPQPWGGPPQPQG